jgi:hypothetical protein
LRSYWGEISRLPFSIIARKVLRCVHRKLVYQLFCFWDHCRKTYSDRFGSKLFQYFPELGLSELEFQKEQIYGLAEYHLAHRFDLLGSGWVKVGYGMRCRGVEGYRYNMSKVVRVDSKGRWLTGLINRSNLKEAQRIWQLVDRGYEPVDWQLDFKSGFRWDASTWYMNIQLGHRPGCDVKVPWELSRCQHFHVFSWAYQLSKDQRYLKEFRNQVLDFIATNPPRFGVNWRCTMDVAIRISNWLIAYDHFRACGGEFDSEFEEELVRSVYAHGQHIATNLEWHPEYRSNHYLADIVGLLFVAAYLPRTSEIDSWLAFAVQELVKEVEYQFTPDGANFEASTSYHRLSAELVVYATALVLGLPPEKQAALKEYDHFLWKKRPTLKPAPLPLFPLAGSGHLTPFPAWYLERLEKMAEFAIHITKPSGHIPQIGDNDSGRFLKIQPIYRRLSVVEAKAQYANLKGYDELPDDSVYWAEDHLDHRHLVAAINGLFSRDDFSKFTGEGWVESSIVRHLAGRERLSSYLPSDGVTAAEQVRIGTRQEWERLRIKLDQLSAEQRRALKIPVPGNNLLDGLKLFAYSDFGLYLFRSRRLYLAVRCGSIGQRGNGGHAHNDQLSIELNVDGEDWITDPGTYLYTPLPERRNEYRSVKAHFTIQLEEREPGNLNLGLFRLGDEAQAECLYFGKEGFIGTHRGYGHPVYRIVEIHDEAIVITDYTEVGVIPKSWEQIVNATSAVLSPGYGIRYEQTHYSFS